MRKTITYALTALFILSSGIIYAQNTQNTEKQSAASPGTDKSEMMEHKDMMKHMMGKHMMMEGMMHKNVVATSDGGVVVVAGNTIAKYDKDLNLVKEVEMKNYTENMKKMMNEMKENCLMEEKEEAGEADHASHH